MPVLALFLIITLAAPADANRRTRVGQRSAPIGAAASTPLPDIPAAALESAVSYLVFSLTKTLALPEPGMPRLNAVRAAATADDIIRILASRTAANSPAQVHAAAVVLDALTTAKKNTSNPTSLEALANRLDADPGIRVRLIKIQSKLANKNTASQHELLDALFDASRTHGNPKQAPAVDTTETLSPRPTDLKRPKTDSTPRTDLSVPSPSTDPSKPSPVGRAAKRLGLVAAAALAVFVGMLATLGVEPASEFLTLFAIEWSLSLDNVFAFSLIFAQFAVPEKLRARLLTMGIAGAFVLRMAAIYFGVELVSQVTWILPIVGALLIFMGLKTALASGENDSPKLAFLERLRPVLGVGTLALIAIIAADIMFAIDSIPAALSISKNFATIALANFLSVLGLGSLYVMLSWLQKHFTHIDKGVGLALAFVGGKMIADVLLHIHIPALASLAVVMFLIGGSLVYSRLSSARRARPL